MISRGSFSHWILHGIWLYSSIFNRGEFFNLKVRSHHNLIRKLILYWWTKYLVYFSQSLTCQNSKFSFITGFLVGNLDQELGLYLSLSFLLQIKKQQAHPLQILKVIICRLSYICICFYWAAYYTLLLRDLFKLV
jgi:hypothetical protein